MSAKKPLLYKNGFSVELPSYRAAYGFYQANKGNVAAGCIMTIPDGVTHLVIVRLISAHDDAPKVSGKTTRANACIRDIEPYRSVVDGSVIGGRRQHRDHLRAHKKIEVGTEYDKYLKEPFKREIKGDFNVGPQLRQAVNQVLSR